MRRKGVIAAGGLAAAVLGATSMAWACTAQLGMQVNPGSVPVGAAMTVEGDGTTGPVEIRWDGADGQVLGIVPDGSAYAAAVEVPEAVPGVHTVVAIAHNADGNVISRGQAAIEVVAPGTRPPSAAQLYSRPPSSGTGSQLSLGVGLLGAGTVALFAGFAAAELRRRKAHAR